MGPNRYRVRRPSYGRGFGVAEFEAEDPAPGPRRPSGWAADLAILTGFGRQGFDTEPQFRNEWRRLSGRGLVHSSAGFRADFCKARHLRVRVNGADKQFALVRGFPVEYSFAVSGKILIKAIGSPSIIDALVRAGSRIVPPLPCPQPTLRYRSPRSYAVIVNFSPPGSAEVKTSEQQKLFDWYFALPVAVRAKIKRGELIVVIEGFTSTTQPAPANKELSQRRTSQVTSALMGIIGPGAKYQIYAHGESKAKTRDDVEDPKERRVRVAVTDS